ncbi:stage V sporulation protein AD [uncultured Ruminococcus sp.]|uniref:stage V sporulation protein AD n=1 Tax=uncultured Ruminococcus sp. TaxID=165186 RepID=UPI000ED7191D|nr:stage V sporulation protein AD [uncultured Ruminococcus sp.]HCI59354.1 stage V sporulation protein AD [Ruminococcus sp.]
MIRRIGGHTIGFEEMPSIVGFASVAGKFESQGPLGKAFDKIIYDSYDGLDTYEQAESRFQSEAVTEALTKAKIKAEEVDCIFAGDLLNQCVGSSYGLIDFGIPYLGQYGACSTMAQGLIMASVFVESGAAKTAMCVTSSHFCSAERQYRFPLEYGGVRTPTAQWTVTGSGSCVLKNAKKGPCIARATVGRIVDLGVKDANNMGAAMAPAAAQTLKNYFDDTGTSPRDYDLILTGDLGEVGSKSLYDLLLLEDIDIRNRHNDCGLMIFDRNKQDVHAGGSGCGCAASVFCSKILSDLSSGIYNNILFMATGALMSPTTCGQGATIPSIAHLVNVKNR